MDRSLFIKVLEQSIAVDHVAGSDGFGKLVAARRGARDEPVLVPKIVDEAIEPFVMQPALEQLAKAGAHKLAFAHRIQQP